MEPIRLWRIYCDGWNYTDDEEVSKIGEPIAALPRADFDALAAEAADARTLRAERDSLVKERERANQSVIESLAIARKALEENDRAEAVLIDKAGVDGDDLAACCEALLVQRDAATARAEKAEADQRMLHFLQDAAKHPGNAELLRALRDLGCDQPAGDPVKMVFIHSPRAFHAPTPDDRKGEDGAWCERGCE